jgi:hypothetical protein
VVRVDVYLRTRGESLHARRRNLFRTKDISCWNNEPCKQRAAVISIFEGSKKYSQRCHIQHETMRRFQNLVIISYHQIVKCIKSAPISTPPRSLPRGLAHSNMPCRPPLSKTRHDCHSLAEALLNTTRKIGQQRRIGRGQGRRRSFMTALAKTMTSLGVSQRSCGTAWSILVSHLSAALIYRSSEPLDMCRGNTHNPTRRGRGCPQSSPDSHAAAPSQEVSHESLARAA